jgi:spermidine/putrescine transport system permease protein
VTLPLLWPAVLSGSVLAFVVSLDDFIMTFFVAGPGSTTLPVYIFSAIKSGVTPEINAISTLMLVISIVLVVLAFWLGQRGKNQ